jgi:hypothetical protein
MYGSLLLYDEQEAIKRGELASKLNYREKKELESKILRKKLVFERYIGYLTAEIDSAHIAPIRAYWIDNIIASTSAFSEKKPFEDTIEGLVFLDEDTIQRIIQDNLDIVTADYFMAMKKSILDYVLLDTNERKRLGISYVHKPTPFWGTEKYKGITADHDLRKRVR